MTGSWHSSASDRHKPANLNQRLWSSNIRGEQVCDGTLLPDRLRSLRCCLQKKAQVSGRLRAEHLGFRFIMQ